MVDVCRRLAAGCKRSVVEPLSLVSSKGSSERLKRFRSVIFTAVTADGFVNANVHF